MLRTFARTTPSRNLTPFTSTTALRVRTMASSTKGKIEETTQAAGEAKDTNPKVQFLLSPHLVYRPPGTKLTLLRTLQWSHQAARWASSSTPTVPSAKSVRQLVVHSPRTALSGRSSMLPRMGSLGRLRRPWMGLADRLPRRSRSHLVGVRE